MMLVCVDPAAETCAPEEDNIDEWVGEMDRRKVRVLGNRLTGVDAATVLVTDGPLAETVAGIYADGAKTREWMGAAYQKSSDRALTPPSVSGREPPATGPVPGYPAGFRAGQATGQGSPRCTSSEERQLQRRTRPSVAASAAADASA
jgi:hypothetical protein